MRPPMNQRVLVNKAILNEHGTPTTDKYGRPLTKRVESKARVRRKSNLIITANGTETNTNIEIDVPSQMIVKEGEEISYIDMDGNDGTGKVISYEEANNVTGSRVLFRTVFVDGR
ncbi:hypothetical protein [Macrococcus sp. S115]|uniref:hypothetical protein n=1 Tax=Macrococcus sp. S115 TaxID=3047480 RepID=UPI0024BC9064|nr:hypothetical protein [Macrococcus sp. S115]MDJ1110624.1 hypothetical protein [Macrococcus sp. S115]